MKTTTKYNHKVLIRKVLGVSCLSAVLGLAGCQPDNPSDQAGQKMNRISEEAKQNIKISNNAANTELKALKDTMEHNAENAKEKIEQGMESSEKVLERSEEKIETNAQLGKKKVEQINDNVEKKLDEIKGSTQSKSETTGEYIDDSIITAKVKAAIIGSSWLRASHIEVTTDKGIVKLSGTVDTEQSITKAIELASGQENVKAVQSDLLVTVTASSKK